MAKPIPTRFSRIAQVVWLLLAILVATTFARDLASGTSTTICHSASACANSGGLDVSTARTLSQHGISLAAFTAFTIFLGSSFLAIWYALGALIIWRKPQDRGALLAAYFLVVFPSFLNSAIPFEAIPLALILFGLLFPDGQFAPRWTRWLALTSILAALAGFVSDGAATLALFVLLLPVLVIQVYRYRSISSWVEKQQTKWVILGLTIGIVGFVGILAIPTQSGSLLTALRDHGVLLVISAIPISIGLSVLRNRLWDIDRVISRALAYATLTLTIAGIYVGGVIGLQALIGLVAGTSSGPAIVISTLAIAALFGPLRRRIQTGIDRRFYRNKYDATRTVAAFGERLRDEVDLGQLSHDLTSVVHDALHPAHVSLWLRARDHGLLATPTLPHRRGSR